MGREFSIYLDLVRFGAALLVFFHHMGGKGIILAPAPFAGFGHSAVLVFFVLSGYVIAYVTDTREKDIRSYTVNRTARIYSVAIPALLLTPLLDFVGRGLAPEFYTGSPSDYWGIRVLSSLMFTNELWFFSIMSFSNLPYWSLNYEVWYYILFAVIQFLSGRRRVMAVIAVLVVMGPKIALLAPLWWLGVACYRSSRLRQLSQRTAWFLLFLSIFLLVAFIDLSVESHARAWLREALGAERVRYLVSSQFFISHYMLAVIVATHLVAVRSIAKSLSPLLLPAESTIRWLAGYTFTLYLLHQPLLLFFAALYDGDPSGWSNYAAVFSSVLIAVFLIGQVSEKRKGVFRVFFEDVYDYAATRFEKSAARPSK